MPEPAVYVMEKMAHGYRRMGRAAGAGFYEYADDGTRTLWSGLKAFERRSAKVPEQDIKDRLLFIQAIESLRCLEEGVVASVSDLEQAAVAFSGFPSAAGGPVQFIDDMGAARFVERAGELASRYGDRFLPPARLTELASRGEPLAGGSARKGSLG
jgi:3-hydroxyacyl-CoA dehydrogenase/enoyl-CoA hydratase/3-hydroxybutyryl-CoA epimerase